MVMGLFFFSNSNNSFFWKKAYNKCKCKIYKKVEIPNTQITNTQNDYETMSKNEQIKRKQTCSVSFVKVFKFQENKFKIVQKNFLEKRMKKDFLENPLVTMIITWLIWAFKGQRLVLIDRWPALICSAVAVKGKFGEASKSPTVLLPWLSEKFSFAFMSLLTLNSSTCQERSYLGWILLHLSKKWPKTNLKVF